jgi:hypothetical protein
MTLSPVLDYGADMGSLVSAQQLETVAHHVDDVPCEAITFDQAVRHTRSTIRGW